MIFNQINRPTSRSVQCPWRPSCIYPSPSNFLHAHQTHPIPKPKPRTVKLPTTHDTGLPILNTAYKSHISPHNPTIHLEKKITYKPKPSAHKYPPPDPHSLLPHPLPAPPPPPPYPKPPTPVPVDFRTQPPTPPSAR